jgi:hypothetical protein
VGEDGEINYRFDDRRSGFYRALGGLVELGRDANKEHKGAETRTKRFQPARK